MATRILKSIKGRAMRVTRLDECGVPVYGPASVVVTHGFISVTLSEEVQTGGEIVQENAYGERCIDESDPDYTRWVNAAVSMCEVHPDVMDIIGGATPVIVGDDTIGFTRGPTANTSAFGLEVWTKKAGADACAPGGVPMWGYFVVPFVKNGRLNGDIAIANAALNVGLIGKGFEAPAAWGIGPHRDNPFRLPAGFPVGEQWGMVTTTVGPPAETGGVAELYGPITAVEPGDIFPAEATVTAEDAPSAALLTGLGYAPADTAAWATGEFFTIGTFTFNWSGTAWAPGAHA